MGTIQLCCHCYFITQSCPALWPHGLQHAKPPCPSPSPSLPKFTFTASVMPSSHLILWHTLLFLPLIFPSITDFSNESSVHIRWPKHLNFSFCISPSSEYSGLISLRLTGLISLLSKWLSGVSSSTAIQRHEFFVILPSLLSSSHNHTWPLGRL